MEKEKPKEDEEILTYYEKDYTPQLNQLVGLIVDAGPSADEMTLLSVLAIMDESLQLVMRNADSNTSDAILAMYSEIEHYLDMDRVDQ
jgi:hypothetical protein